HSQVSWFVSFPPGMKGFGFVSASAVHLPTKYPSFLCSGPGFGFSPGACASASPVDRTRQAANGRGLVLMIHLRELAGILTLLVSGMAMSACVFRTMANGSGTCHSRKGSRSSTYRETA